MLNVLSHEDIRERERETDLLRQSGIKKGKSYGENKSS